MSNAAATPVREAPRSGFLHTVIIAQGVLTVFLALAAFPLGVGAMLVNAVLAGVTEVVQA